MARYHSNFEFRATLHGESATAEHDHETREEEDGILRALTARRERLLRGQASPSSKPMLHESASPHSTTSAGGAGGPLPVDRSVPAFPVRHTSVSSDMRRDCLSDVLDQLRLDPKGDTIVQAIDLRRCDINETNEQNSSLLHIAAAAAHPELLLRLLAPHRAAERCGVDSLGRSPLDYMAAFLSRTVVDASDVPTARLRLSRQSSLTATKVPSEERLSAWRAMVRRGDPFELFAHLEDESANSTAKDGLTMLMLAVEAENLTVIRILLLNGADLYVEAEDRRRAADFTNSEDILNMLTPDFVSQLQSGMTDVLLTLLPAYPVSDVEGVLERGLNIDYQDIEGKTLLMRAISEAKPDIVELLLRREANLLLQDATKRTAADYASNSMHNGIVQLVLGDGPAHSDHWKCPNCTFLLKRSENLFCTMCYSMSPLLAHLAESGMWSSESMASLLQIPDSGGAMGASVGGWSGLRGDAAHAAHSAMATAAEARDPAGTSAAVPRDGASDMLVTVMEGVTGVVERERRARIPDTREGIPAHVDTSEPEVARQVAAKAKLREMAGEFTKLRQEPDDFY